MLRPYQDEGLRRPIEYLSRTKEGNPCVEIPTGGGKSHIIAELAKWVIGCGGRVVCVAPSKELVEQQIDKLERLGIEVGVWCAGLGRKEAAKPVTIASIQSIYKAAAEFPPIDLVIVDEAHLIPPDGDGMFRKFLADVQQLRPGSRVVGFTATPYRTSSGPICGLDQILTEIVYRAEVPELIEQGYLSPMRAKQPCHDFDASGLRVRNGEFRPEDVEAAVMETHALQAACGQLIEYTQDRKSVLIFAASVQHAWAITWEIEGCWGVFGDTPTAKRREAIEKFRSGEIKYLVNVNVLSTGFDAPNVDAVAMMRPTLSPGLYYQQVGRGFRLSPDTGKTDCLVLDFAGNCKRHGPVDAIEPVSRVQRQGGEAPVKECPACRELVAAGVRNCPACEHEFPEPEVQHNASVQGGKVLSTEPAAEPETFGVIETTYRKHLKRQFGTVDLDAPPTLRVDYNIGAHRLVSEWVCIEHTGYAREKAEKWWAARSSESVPATVDDALDVINAGGICETLSVSVKPDGQFQRVQEAVLGDIPEVVRDEA